MVRHHARIVSATSGFIPCLLLLLCVSYFSASPSHDRIPSGSSHNEQSRAPPCSFAPEERPSAEKDAHRESGINGDGAPPRLVQKRGQVALLAKNPLQSQVPGGLEGTSIDWEFIAAREGGQRLTGYVVRIRNTRSGVTVATGVDLGQRSPADIDRLLIPEELKSTLKSYATKKGEEARAYLKSHPLILTKPEADAIDTVVRKSIAGSVRKSYNNAVMGRGELLIFEELPPEAQTVIASVAFQYGPNLKRATPRFWESVTCQDWEKAVGELRSFGDRYGERRASEARLLAEAARRVCVSRLPSRGAGS